LNNITDKKTEYITLKLSRKTDMSKIFITGSSDGLGLLAARMLLEKGHRVVLHARSKKHADDIIAQELLLKLCEQLTGIRFPTLSAG